MKITIDVELSPKEARELVGWPDLSSLHESTLQQLQAQVQGGDPDAISALFKHYFEGGQTALNLYSKLVESLTASQSKST